MRKGRAPTLFVSVQEALKGVLLRTLSKPSTAKQKHYWR